MALTSSGIGSGLDIDSLVTQLVRAEGSAPSLRLNKREAGFQSDLSAIGQLKSVLSEFQSNLGGLSNVVGLQPRSASSSDRDLFTAKADNTASAGTYDVEVLTLAQSAKVRSNSFTDSDTEVIGTGTLDISLGTTTFQIAVDASNNTLAGIRDAINAASDNPGVTASIINVDGGPQLVLDSNDIGAANTITVAAVDDDGADGFDLTRLDSASLTDVQVAQDATFNLDNQLVTRGSNSFSDVIEGVTIDLKKEAVGTTETLTVALDKGAVTANVKSFALSYNKLADTLKKLSSFDPETKVAGPLQGDSALRGVQNNLRSILGDSIDGLAYGTLAEIGVTTDEAGHFQVDGSKLDAALAADFTSISQLFAGENALVSKLDEVLGRYLASDGVLESRTSSLKKGIKDVADDREQLGRRLESIEKRYRAQFNAMDTLLGQLQSTSGFLSQQLSNLPGVVRKTK
ncbi:MAG: flagellar filament capping protein FliD [Methylomarinum sp.]|nr:flagellar filament capping protein FliD [Methylomarinum sp.]